MSRLSPYNVAQDGYNALVAVESYVKKCGLEPRLLSLVKTRVSQINGCAYCLHMHSQEALQAGETQVRLLLLDAWRESALYSPRERAALAWAESLTNISETHAPDEVYEEARRIRREAVGRSFDRHRHDKRLDSWLSIGFRAQHPSDRAKAA